jgi:putative DNA primase/helicase
MATRDRSSDEPEARRAESAENAIRPRRARTASQDPAAIGDPPANALRPAAPRVRDSGSQAAAGAEGADARRKAGDAVPSDVRDRFVQVGRNFYFPDGAHAFTDRGRRLVSPSENTEVVRSLVEIAKARGWDEVVVSGTERFRKEAWAAGQLAGVTVRGYRASEFEKETLARAVARRRQQGERVDDETFAARSPRDARDRAAPSRERGDELIRGRMVDHGAAPYLHRRGEPPSYFVTVETLRGLRTVWGQDLARAVKESLTQPKAGDEIGLRVVAREPVTVKRLLRGEDGRSLEVGDAQVSRNRWVVEKAAFYDERAAAADLLRNAEVKPLAAVRERPELTGTYLYLKGAEEVAKQKIRDPADQQRFVSLVRAALADSIERGEPMPAVRIRERAAKPARKVEREQPTR